MSLSKWKNAQEKLFYIYIYKNRSRGAILIFIFCISYLINTCT